MENPERGMVGWLPREAAFWLDETCDDNAPSHRQIITMLEDYSKLRLRCRMLYHELQKTLDDLEDGIRSRALEDVPDIFDSCGHRVIADQMRRLAKHGRVRLTVDNGARVRCRFINSYGEHRHEQVSASESSRTAR